MNGPYLINDRISIDNELATIRYVGPIEPWGESVVALGIEWDDPNRGKNNGCLKGKQYFTTSHPQSGSFIKSTNSNICQNCSFVDVLKLQYGSTAEFDEISLGSKVTESYGFNKLNTITNDFAKLESISLEKKSIRQSGLLEDLSLANLSHLDLSFNLFVDFQQVENVLTIAPQIRQLNLNGNRFSEYTKGSINLSVKSLRLSSTFIKIDLLTAILANFPNLEELYLASNNYDNDDILQLFRSNNLNLKLLDLSFNRLSHIPNLSIDSIILANNTISSLDFGGDFSPSLLDLRDNLINDWYECDKLIQLPNLKQLRINGNPVFDDYTSEEQEIYLTARANFHGKLNGTTPSPEEIANADLYFISQVKNGKIEYIKGQRWQDLLNTYQIHDTEVSKDSQTHLQRKLLNLNIHYMDHTLSRVFLNNNTILRLKGIIANTWDLPILNIKIYYLLDNIKLFLDDDIANLDNYGFSQGQELYVDIGDC